MDWDNQIDFLWKETSISIIDRTLMTSVDHQCEKCLGKRNHCESVLINSSVKNEEKKWNFRNFVDIKSDCSKWSHPPYLYSIGLSSPDYLQVSFFSLSRSLLHFFVMLEMDRHNDNTFISSFVFLWFNFFLFQFEKKRWIWDISLCNDWLKFRFDHSERTFNRFARMPSVTDVPQQTSNIHGKTTPPPPSSSSTTQQATSSDATSGDAMTQSIQVLEKKLRNLGKRKVSTSHCWLSSIKQDDLRFFI